MQQNGDEGKHPVQSNMFFFEILNGAQPLHFDTALVRKGKERSKFFLKQVTSFTHVSFSLRKKNPEDDKF